MESHNNNRHDDDDDEDVERKFTPLHSAMQCFKDANMTEDAFEALFEIVEDHPKCIGVVDPYYGMTPLHVACERAGRTRSGDGYAVLVIERMIDLSSRSTTHVLSQVTPLGLTPLHVAVLNSGSLELIRKLIDRYPEAVGTADQQGDTPLHDACRRYVGASSEHNVISCMIDAHPQALARQNNRGDTPLHVLCRRCVYPRVLMQVLNSAAAAISESIKSAISTPNWNGWTPLHHACSNIFMSSNVVETMIQLHPHGLAMRTKLGNTVLHLACKEESVSTDLLAFLINSWSVACLIQSDRANLKTDETDKLTPYDWTVTLKRPTTKLVASATCTVALALIDYALRSNVKTTIPRLAIAHLQEAYDAHRCVWKNKKNKAVSDKSFQKALHALLTNEILQTQVLQRASYQRLICGLVRLDQSRRRYLHKSKRKRNDNLRVLASVSDDLDCVYIHLRELPDLCCRRR